MTTTPVYTVPDTPPDPEAVHVLSYSLPTAWDTAIEGWLAWLIAAGTSPATRRTRRAHVRRVARELGAADPRDVTGADLLAILGRPAYSIEHRRGLRASLASFYRWCTSSGTVSDDPTLTLPVVRTPAGAPKPATDEIWRHILVTADERTRLMARLAGEAGLRRAEVAQVHTDDLNGGIGGPELIVHGKGGKQRMVPITVTLAADIAAACPHGGFLWPGKIDGHISPDRVGHLVSKVMPAGWSIHKLRHRFASRGFAGTGNLRAVQLALGHASVATTQRYVAVAARDLRAVTEAAAYSSAPEKAGDKRPPTESADTTFENVIRGWDDVPRCEVASLATHQGGPCRRRAKWRLNLHGCLQLLVCERDMQAFKRHQLEAICQGRVLACVHCGGTFERLDDSCTITRL
jgi:site-specific recombinase XerD